MAVVLIILGLLQIGYAVLVQMSAASAIHEILAAVSFGLGCLCLGVSGIIVRLDDIKEIRKSSEHQAEALQALIDRRAANNQV
ncbi:hypothetical protein [Rhizobium rhizogenes]|uniref:hypothetical protein n=1 Tax=Rhizobium rhizogenes TaxID=359 RepID=UPI001571E253|nr:hypothetical protein [Rhizobium rhizogenes]NTI41613.1 hypothetical protein [Rhizobium rhizogenes]